MKCPQCQTANSEERRFCAECGAPLASACPDCGFTNNPGAKFCGGCGRGLDSSTAAEAAVTKRESPEAERRQLTVMFCDLVGSTALAERLDPEELRGVLAQYQDACANVVGYFDGRIARYIGDGLLVYFGFPQAHEDDAQRAVRAGLGIIEAIRELDAKIEYANVSLAVRIGITTGLVVVGDIGDGERVEKQAVVGETPNLAARLQALAEPNMIVIAASTQRLVEGLFDCDDLGPQDLSGISQPVTAYRVREESGIPSRFEAKATRGLTPLVAREEEIRLLLERWSEVKDGEGQVVLLSGEAGIGKSRIVRGLQERMGDEPHSRVLYYGSPYHQHSAFYPIIDQLERGLRLEKGDSSSGKLGKLEAVLGKLGLPLAEHAFPLASLLSLPVGNRYSSLELSPAQLKKRTLRTLVAIVAAMASQRPVLMLVEDLHWIDPSTREFITQLLEQLHTSRLLIVAAFRPEFESRWGGYAHVTSLALNRLSRKASATMVVKVTQGKALPDDVLDQIIAKTDGVPLFVEELTKTVLESGLLNDVDDQYVLSGPLPPLAIPASLQDSLMARLDRLAPVKEVAQLAATLGRTFTRELFAAISPLSDEELENALNQLMDAELIYRRGLMPDVTYEFKHALVQDAAYQSLLRSTRQQYHQRIAQTLEEQFPQTAKTEPELLAHHYTEGGLIEQAIPHWHRAGQQASEHSANVEAVAHLRKGLELVENLPDTSEHAERELALYIALGPALMSIKGWAAQDVERAYSRARELARQISQPSEYFTATWGLWLHFHNRNQLDTAQGLSNELLALAQKQSDSAYLLQAHHAAWTTDFSRADLLACRDHAEQGLALYDLDKHRAHKFLYGGHDPGVCAWNHSAMSLWFLGYADQSLAKAHQAVALTNKVSHPFSAVITFCFSSWLHQYRREPLLAREFAQAAIDLSTQEGIAPHYRAATSIVRGWTLAVGEEPDAGIAEIREGLSTLRVLGHELRRSYFLYLLADAYGRTGQVDQALDALAQALDLVESTGERRWQAEIHRLRGVLLARSADSRAEAETCFNQAIQVAQQQSAKSLELRAASNLAGVWFDQGKRVEAHDLLAPVYAWFTEGLGTADLQEAKGLLEKLA